MSEVTGQAAPRRLVLASNNAKKLAELQALFTPLGVTLVRQGDLGIPEAEFMAMVVTVADPAA